jgi:hypothetical protein
MPPKQSSTPGEPKSPCVTKVAGLATTMPPFFRPMKAMKRPMPQVMAQLQLVGDGGDDLLAHAGDGEAEKDDAVDEHEAQGRLPRDAQPETDGEGEIGVDAHARGEGQRVVGQEPHEQGADGGGEGGDGDQRGRWHARGGEDGGIDREDVGHRGERRRAGGEFAAHRRAVLVQLVESVEHGGHWAAADGGVFS